jgi:restriction system protein
VSNSMWMVRGEGGTLIQKFLAGSVAVGWHHVGDLSSTTSRESVRSLYEGAYPEDSPGKATNGIGVLFKFRATLNQADKVLTYDPNERQYHIGELTSDYRFSVNEVGADWPHVRTVRWLGSVSRDDLSPATRNTLGSTLTLFSINEDAAAEVLAVLEGIAKPTGAIASIAKEELSNVKDDESAKAFELIKDAIVALTPSENEHLVAALLRAMGYRARVTPTGPDRGVDVIASPDGLGLEEPRIKAEVKHRPKTAMGAPEIRSFLGVLRQGDRGLYMSTGGFTKEARYEAERSPVPVTLVSLEDLASLVVSHYEDFDVEGRVLLPLFKIYLPGE